MYGTALMEQAPAWSELAAETREFTVVSALVDQGIAAGFPVGRYYTGMHNILLLAFTEKRTKEEIDIMVAKLESVLGT